MLHRCLLLLIRSSLAFPRELDEGDKEIMAGMRLVVERLSAATERAFEEAQARLQSLVR
jgi:hypothetical protein